MWCWRTKKKAGTFSDAWNWKNWWLERIPNWREGVTNWQEQILRLEKWNSYENSRVQKVHNQNNCRIPRNSKQISQPREAGVLRHEAPLSLSPPVIPLKWLRERSGKWKRSKTKQVGWTCCFGESFLTPPLLRPMHGMQKFECLWLRLASRRPVEQEWQVARWIWIDGLAGGNFLWVSHSQAWGEWCQEASCHQDGLTQGWVCLCSSPQALWMFGAAAQDLLTAHFAQDNFLTLKLLSGTSLSHHSNSRQGSGNTPLRGTRGLIGSSPCGTEWLPSLQAGIDPWLSISFLEGWKVVGMHLKSSWQCLLEEAKLYQLHPPSTSRQSGSCLNGWPLLCRGETCSPSGLICQNIVPSLGALGGLNLRA